MKFATNVVGMATIGGKESCINGLARPFRQIPIQRDDLLSGTASALKIVEAHGSVMLSRWQTCMNLSTRASYSLPTLVIYEKNVGGTEKSGQPERLVFSAELNPIGIESVAVRKGTDEQVSVEVEGRKAARADGVPEWAAKAVEKDLLPWLIPLMNERFNAAVISRNENGKVVAVDFKGYHVSWDAPADSARVEKLGQSHIIHAGSKCDVYFCTGKLQYAVAFECGKIAGALKRTPPGNRFERCLYVPRKIKQAASTLFSELLIALTVGEELREKAEAQAETG